MTYKEDSKEDRLMQWGVKAFDVARETEETSAGVSEFVAMAVGNQARRYGFTEKELSSWLQSAYSSLWVKQSRLNPGLDLKDVRAIVLKAFNMKKRSRLESFINRLKEEI
jgi:hypothetical protein